MTLRCLPLLAALAGALAASPAFPQTPLPPSIAQGGASEPAAKKPASKPRPKPAKPAAAAAPPPARAAAKPTTRGYSEPLPLPRKIDRNEIDDPYGSSSPDPFGNRMRPNVTPSGGMGMGGRF